MTPRANMMHILPPSCIMLTVVMLSIIVLVYRCTDCHYIECHYATRHCAACHYVTVCSFLSLPFSIVIIYNGKIL